MGNFCDDCGALLSPVTEECPNCGRRDRKSEEEEERSGIFPFEKVREGQSAFLKDCKETFHSGNTLLAHAPTGIGKTAAVLTAAVKERDDEKIFFLTSKQSQHHIAIETAKKMPSKVTAVDVISKQNMCPRDESKLPYPVFQKFCSEKGQHMCNLYDKNMGRVIDRLRGQTRHVDEIIDICNYQNVCPHKAALGAGKDADIIVCDYNYVFSDVREKIFELLDMELDNAIVIVDEAHNLPDRVRSHLEEKISLPTLKDARQLLQGHASQLAGFVKRLSFELSKEEGEERRVSKDFFDGKVDTALRGGFGRFEKMDDLMEDLEMVARDLIEKDSSASAPLRLYSFLSAWQNEGEHVFRSFEPGSTRLEVKLLDPSKLTKGVFNNISSSVLMSGTLHPGKMYADLLGIEEPVIKKYESPFPDENRRIVSVDHVTTSYKERSLKMFQAYANSIADVGNNVEGNVAVFFPSYALMEKISDRLKLVHVEKELLIEKREHAKWEKEEMVDSLKSTDDKLLMGVQGGSLSEGVDYKDNILSAIVIAGIPFPPPSLETQALEEYYTKKFDEKRGYDYTRIYPALNRVLQASGRPIRSSSDRALIILMDKRFNYPFYKNMLPDGFDYDIAENVVDTCKDFFEDH